MRKSHGTGKRGRIPTRPNTESVERERAYARQYYWDHRDEVLAKAQERRQGNPTQRRKADPEKRRIKRREAKNAFAQANKTFMRDYKLAKGCLDCGYAEHSVALQFDHRPGTDKKYNVSSLSTRSREFIQQEIDKCDVRCANCHAVITEQRRLEGQ